MEMSQSHFNNVRISRSLCSLGPFPYYNIASTFLLIHPFHFRNKQRELLSRESGNTFALFQYSYLHFVSSSDFVLSINLLYKSFPDGSVCFWYFNITETT